MIVVITVLLATDLSPVSHSITGSAIPQSYRSIAKMVNPDVILERHLQLYFSDGDVVLSGKVASATASLQGINSTTSTNSFSHTTRLCSQISSQTLRLQMSMMGPRWWR